MAMSGMAKLGISAGLGSGTTLATDAGLRYWAERAPKDADQTDLEKQNWYYRRSSLIGGVASLVTAGVLWKVWGAEEGVVAAVAGIGTAIAVPAHEYVDEARVTAETATKGLGRLTQIRQAARTAQAGA